MDDGAKYVLAKGVKYRREGFGAVAMNVNAQAAHFYNRTGAQVLEQCTTPVSIRTLGERLTDAGITQAANALCTFIDGCVEAAILTTSPMSEDAGGKLYFTDIEQFSDDAFFTPLAVEIETTLKCLRACMYCAYDSGIRAGSPSELTSDRWLRVLDHLEAEGVLYLHFTGGDPLTRRDIFELLTAADDRDFVITVSSDLTVLTEDQAARLGRLRNLFALQTTLDGATAKSADSLRGHGNFERVTTGLRTLNRHGVPVSVGTIVTKLNVEEITDIGHFLADFDVYGYCVAPLYPAGRGREISQLVPDNADMSKAIKQFRSLVEDGIIRPADPAWWSIVEALEPEDFEHLVDDQPFLARQPDRVLRINSLGDCYSSIKLKEYLRDQMFVGNIERRGLREIWHQSPLLTSMRMLEPEPSQFGNVVDLRKVGITLQASVR